MGTSTQPPGYEVGFAIGSGGMATVSYGRRVGAGGFAHAVAIKQLHPHLASNAEVVAMFLDEARLAARVVHANVVSILDIVQQGPHVWAVMQYIEGDSLARLAKQALTSGRRVPVRVAASIVIDLLAGLEAAHTATDGRGEALGIVHRDVSPQNVIVGVDGVARVLDFGVAKARGRLHETVDGQVKGKLAYMAPEQLGGDANVSTDVYAAAIVLWELLAGRRLFDAPTEVGVVRQVMQGVTAPPSRYADVPEALDALVMSALSLDPSKRFASAADMVRALSAACDGNVAQRAEVAAWVMEIAGDGIAERRARAVEMASRPQDEAQQLRPAPVDTAQSWVSTMVMPRSSAPYPVVLSSSGSFPAPGRKARWGATAVAVALALAGAAFGTRTLARATATSDAPSAVAVAGDRPAAPPLELLAPPAAPLMTTETAAPSRAEPAPAVAPAPPRVAKVDGTKPKGSAKVAAASSGPAAMAAMMTPSVMAEASPAVAVAASSAAECDPPYVVDASGFRRYKRSCIR